MKRFADEHQLLFSSTDYLEFLSKIDAVYIASPHETHYRYAKEALLAGKHVLCEKPMALTVSEVEELYAIAEQQQLVLMEAIKTAYCPGFMRLLSLAKSGKIGEIKSVDAAFTKLVPVSFREMQVEHAGGSVNELGTYPLYAIFKLLGADYKDYSIISSFKNGIDIFTKLDFVYDRAVASAKVGLGVKTEGELVISGTRGYIYVPAPWWKTEYFELRFENGNDTEKYYYKFAGEGLRYETAEFLKRIREKETSNAKDSLNLAKIIEEFNAKKNVKIIL